MKNKQIRYVQDKEIGHKLKEGMEINNVSGKELARMINVSPSTISNYLSGIRSPDTQTLLRLCDILHLDIYELFGLENIHFIIQNQHCKKILSVLKQFDSEEEIDNFLNVMEKLSPYFHK